MGLSSAHRDAGGRLSTQPGECMNGWEKNEREGGKKGGEGRERGRVGREGGRENLGLLEPDIL